MSAGRGSSRRVVTGLLVAVDVCLCGSSPVGAQSAIDVTIKNHRFFPAEIHVPARTTVILNFKNEDATAEEFDSTALKIEKVIAGGKDGTVRLRPLDPGHYPFMGEYHPDTAQGVVIVQ
jgi:plastocyanin